MLKMDKESRLFLEEHLPEALKMNSCNDALDLLYDLIDEKGFAPPNYDEYNDFGRQAQKVYDDIYLSNGGTPTAVLKGDIWVEIGRSQK